MKNPHFKQMIFTAVIILGIALRIIVAMRGHNYDVESFTLVAQLVSEGKNVYGNISRYSYGPAYFLILGFMYKAVTLFFSPTLVPIFFRFTQTLFLTAVDIGIMLFLRKKFNLTASILFFLNPISIIVTGYHSQIDNFAIFTALIAASIFTQNKRLDFGKKQIAGLLLLGLSLVIKHVFLAFPFWLSMKEKSWKNRLITFILPLVVFVLSFLPYIGGGLSGIIKNVILYRSGNNAPFFYFLLPKAINLYVSSYVIFYIALIISGIIFYRVSAMRSLLYYLGILLIFSPSISPQYIVIPVALMAVYPNIFYFLYTLLGTIDFIFVNVDELHFREFQHVIPSPIIKGIGGYRGADDWLVVFLFLGFIWMFKVKTFKKKIGEYIKVVINPSLNI
jgi:hypothetical protein